MEHKDFEQLLKDLEEKKISFTTHQPGFMPSIGIDKGENALILWSPAKGAYGVTLHTFDRDGALASGFFERTVLDQIIIDFLTGELDKYPAIDQCGTESQYCDFRAALEQINTGEINCE